MDKLHLLALLVAWVLLTTVHGDLKVRPEEFPPDGENPSPRRGLIQPRLNDEEANSDFIPTHMKCDGCKAVAFQLYQALTRTEKKFKRLKGIVPESAVLETFENTCHAGTFREYAVEDVRGTNRLFGPGIEESTGTENSLVRGGGPWPSRLASLCKDFIDEPGEEEIYEGFEGLDEEHFQRFLCSGSRYCNGKILDEL